MNHNKCQAITKSPAFYLNKEQYNLHKLTQNLASPREEIQAKIISSKETYRFWRVHILVIILKSPPFLSDKENLIFWTLRAIEVRSVTSEKFKFVKLWDWLAYSEKTGPKKKPLPKISLLESKLVRRFKHCYALMTLYKPLLRFARIVMLTIF